MFYFLKDSLAEYWLTYIPHLIFSPSLLAASFVVIFLLRLHSDYFLIIVHLWIGVIFFWDSSFLKDCVWRKSEKLAMWAHSLDSDLLFRTFSHLLYLLSKHAARQKDIYLAHIEGWDRRSDGPWQGICPANLNQCHHFCSPLPFETNSLSSKTMHGMSACLITQQHGSSIIWRMLFLRAFMMMFLTVLK